MSRFPVFALVAVLALSGCSDPQTPTTPTTPATVPTSLNTFVAHIEPLGQAQFFFQLIESSAAVRVTLAALTTDGQSRALDAALRMQVGAPTTDGCADTLATTTAAGLKSQVQGTLPIGTYCVQVKDLGSMAEGGDVTIRIHIQPPADADSTGTETFASNLALNGFSSRSFVAKQTGQVTATLDSLGAPDGSTIVMGIGVQGDNTQTACRLSTMLPVLPGGIVTAAVDPGFYCIGLTKLSVVQNQTPFSATIKHP